MKPKFALRPTRPFERPCRRRTLRQIATTCHEAGVSSRPQQPLCRHSTTLPGSDTARHFPYQCCERHHRFEFRRCSSPVSSPRARGPATHDRRRAADISFAAVRTHRRLSVAGRESITNFKQYHLFCISVLLFIVLVLKADVIVGMYISYLLPEESRSTHMLLTETVVFHDSRQLAGGTAMIRVLSIRRMPPELKQSTTFMSLEMPLALQWRACIPRMMDQTRILPQTTIQTETPAQTQGMTATIR